MGNYVAMNFSSSDFTNYTTLITTDLQQKYYGETFKNLFGFIKDKNFNGDIADDDDDNGGNGGCGGNNGSDADTIIIVIADAITVAVVIAVLILKNKFNKKSATNFLEMLKRDFA